MLCLALVLHYCYKLLALAAVASSKLYGFQLIIVQTACLNHLKVCLVVYKKNPTNFVRI